MSNAFIKSIPRKVIGNGEMASSAMGEIWLMMQENPGMAEAEAIRAGIGKAVVRDVDCTEIRQKNESLDELIAQNEEFNGVVHEALGIDKLDYNYKLMRGLSDCESHHDDEEIDDDDFSILTRCSPVLRSILGQMGKSVRTLFERSSKPLKKSQAQTVFSKGLDLLNDARREGCSEKRTYSISR